MTGLPGIVASGSITDPAKAQGVLMTQGGVAGGHSLYLKDGRPHYSLFIASLVLKNNTLFQGNAIPRGDVILGVK